MEFLGVALLEEWQLYSLPNGDRGEDCENQADSVNEPRNSFCVCEASGFHFAQRVGPGSWAMRPTRARVFSSRAHDVEVI
jgi:hypothetical protein